jgi:Asp-tRNA(Asn)/Glu-tRNA(Gln) amidotransferase A subunit family amidase
MENSAGDTRNGAGSTEENVKDPPQAANVPCPRRFGISAMTNPRNHARAPAPPRAGARPAAWVLGAFLAGALVAGCSTPFDRSTNVSRDYAFIEYWPPDANGDSPRLAVKDLIDMKGVVTTAGSKYLAVHGTPAARDAACLALARAQNVRIVGKTNLGEFGTGVSGVNGYFGTPLNPLNPRYRFVPGGSSSGSAVSVATGMADVALGTDTAGSIRIPAACCGVAGLKTTFGLVPLRGVFPLSPKHLDTVGPLARNVSGLLRGMALLQAGFANHYRKVAAACPPAREITVGRLYVKDTDPAIDKAVDDALAASGFRVVRLDEAFAAKWADAQRDGKTVALADAWLSDRKYSLEGGVSELTRATLRLGQIEYATVYADALKHQPAWQRALRRIFRKVDFIAMPTLRKLPPRISRFGRSALLELRVFDIQNTVAVNFAGNPALAMPVPMESKFVPVASLQLVGPMGSEAELLHAGGIVESKVGMLHWPRRAAAQ